MISDTNCLNQNAKPFLSRNVVKPYILDEVGTEIVFKANSELKEAYTIEHEYTPPQVFLRHFAATLKKYAGRNFKTAIDVCCGTGFISIYLAQKKIVQKIWSIDLNESSLNKLRQQLKKESRLDIQVLEQNFFSSDLRPGSVDLIVGNSFLHHLPDNSAFFKKSFDLLESGGVLFLSHEPSSAAEIWENPAAFLRNFILPSKALHRLSDIWLYSEGGLKSLAQEAGFKNIEIQSYGLLSTVFGFTFNLIWTRGFRQKSLPQSFYTFLYSLKITERKILWFLPKDWFVSFMLLARKP